MVFMLISYLVLPAQKTRSHYLSVCLIVAIMMIAIGFTIPLSAEPDQCFNEITPNDMYSSNECAWSGAFIIAGGLCATMWIFIRALSMNLQICWDIVPGRKFFYVSQAIGWGIPAVLFTATLTVTGVSFRFGAACHVNHDRSMGDFWGPLMAFAGLAGILQVCTFAYCIHVYLKNLWSDQAQASSNGSSSGLPSYSNSVRTQTAKAVWRRLQKVLWLQWRGICIVSIILVDVVFFAIVFVYLDGLQNDVVHDWRKVEPWLTCLAFHPADKSQCLPLVHGWLVNEPTVVAVLLLLSLTGVQAFLFLTRPSIFPAWVEFLSQKFGSRQEFVSLDARPDIMRANSSKQHVMRYERGHQSTVFEMQRPQQLALDIGDTKTFSPTQTSVLSSPDEAYKSPLHMDRSSPSMDGGRQSPSLMGRGRIPPEYVGRVTPEIGRTSPQITHGSTPPPVGYSSSLRQQREPADYFTTNRDSAERPSSRTSAEQRRYNAPASSFSVPKTPSRQSSLRSVTFDPRETYSRGGLALNPPSEAGESQENLSQQDVSRQGLGKR